MTTKSELTPTDYFTIIKGRKEIMDNDELNHIYDNCLTLLEKSVKTGQTLAARKLMFLLDSIEKEREVVKKGITTFVYRNDVEAFIEDVSDEVVKIIELKDYQREIPDDVVKLFEPVKNDFDAFYVLFTDYTGEAEKHVEQERRDKDPILFGAFRDEATRSMVDRFYYIADWEDEWCHLTLEKMVNEMKAKTNRQVDMTISTPKTLDELRQQVALLEEAEGGFRMTHPRTPSNQPVSSTRWTQKLTSFFKRKRA